MARRKPRAFETVICRSGDQVGAWSYALLSGFGLSLTGIALAAVPLSIVWLLNSFWLGHEQGRMGAAQEPLSRVPV
jgi:AAA family ATP:ADP antiporter